MSRRFLSAIVACGIFINPLSHLKAQSSAPLCSRTFADKTYGSHEFFPTTVTPARGVVLAVHGLNNKPEIMDAFIREMNSRGFHGMRVTLTAHDGNPEFKHEASADRWLEDLRSAYCDTRIKYPELPIYGVGYSLGGALSVRLQEQSNERLFRSMILFAPAIGVRWFSGLARPLTFLRHLNVSLWSVAAERYRVYSTTSFQSYRALFDTVDAVQKVSNPLWAEIPIAIFCHAEDRLIEPKKLKRWLSVNRLAKARLHQVEIGEKVNEPDTHLITGPDEVGIESWQKIMSYIETVILYA